MRAGSKVVCVDDTGWLLPDIGRAPIKDGIYCVSGTHLFGSILAISLVGFDDGWFYRACRFRPLAQTDPTHAEEEEAQCPSAPAA